jgi:hypothetical protein
MNPFVFVVGCARSGTTLLKRVLNAHPQIAITKETHWIPVFFRERIGLTPDGLVTPELIPRLLADWRFSRQGIGRPELESLLGSGAPVSYAKFVSGIFDLYGQAQGKLLVGDKTPIYGLEMGLLHELWPRAKFVHLIRDGRDVCLSVRNWERRDGGTGLEENFATWAEDPVTTAAVWWQWRVQLAREAGQPLGPGLYYELRYEALVNHPAEECAKLCAFLGVPYEEKMLRFYEGHTKTKKGLNSKRAWLPITPGLRDWRTQMPAQDTERFEAAAGSLLDELAYPRAVARPQPAVLENASRIRNLFIREPGVRGRGLPARW